jgi:hypothetical protein
MITPENKVLLQMYQLCCGEAKQKVPVIAQSNPKR